MLTVLVFLARLYKIEPAAVLEVADQLPAVKASKERTEGRDPLLDTGASHLLVNLDHLTEEQASEATRIHVKQATGSPKRALLLNGVIYAANVGRVLVSVGALRERLRLDFDWTGSDPMLVFEDAQGRWELFRGSVDGRLPVLTQAQFEVLFRAYQDSFLGVVWDRQRWVDELGGKDLTKAVAHVTVTLGATQVRNFEDEVDQVLPQSIPATASRTNVQDDRQVRPLKSQNFGAAISRGRRITSPVWRFPAHLTAVLLLAACRDAHDLYTTSQVNETPPVGMLSPEQTATTHGPAMATGELKPSEAPTLSNNDSTDLIYHDDTDDALEQYLRKNTQGDDRTSLSVTASQVELLRECLLDEAPVQFSTPSLTARTSVEVMDALGEMAAHTSVEVMAALGEIADALEVAKSQGKDMALQSENEPTKVDDEQLELQDVLGVGSAKVRDRTSPTEDVDDAKSHKKKVWLSCQKIRREELTMNNLSWMMT